MADPSSSPSKVEPTTLPPQPTQPENPTPQPDPPPQLQSQPPLKSSDPTPPIQNPNPNPNPVAPIPSFPPLSSSFRLTPSFSPSPLPNYQSTPLPVAGLPPPGVAAPSPLVPPVLQFQVPVPGQSPNPALRPPFAPLPNGYTPPPPPPPQGTVPLPGIARYPSPYPAMVRPLFPMRPPGAPVVLQVGSRPLMPGVGGVRPIIPPILRPVIPSVTPAEKPLTTVYVGKIAPTVEDDFIQSLLRICGPAKSWKRPQDSSGTHRGFGFCEFESPEGVLRALRLLDKFNLDGQELMLNVDEATKGYLGRYVEKKTENSKKLKETQAAGSDNEGQGAPSEGKHEPPKSSADDSSNENDKSKMENHDHSNFGIVTDEDKEGDQVATETITSRVEERLKTKPVPLLPPPPTIDSSGNQPADLEAKLRNGDTTDNDANEYKHDDETTSDNKATSEQDRLDTSSPDKNRRSDRRSRDRERDLKWEQEREIERYERETERERVRKEREQRRKMEEAERVYEERLRDWDYREREREKQRQYEREREKEKERKRRKEVLLDEDEDDDSRKRWRRSALEERRIKRLREKEEDLADRLKEEEDIAEAKRREEMEKQQRDATKLSAGHIINGGEKAVVEEAACAENKDNADEHNYEPGSGNEDYYKGDVGSTVPSVAESETRQIVNPPTKRLGFGLAGSGKRAAVPSVFNEEDDDEAHKEKKMRPLVPIDYSTEELQAIQPTVSGAQPPNLAAAAEYAKRISSVVPKEERPDSEREKNRRTHDRSSQRERDHNDDVNRWRDESKEKVLERDRDRENGAGKVKTPDKLKLLDAKQLIDMIPKTKDELFSFEINWAVYDKHQLHERMRPWISKKITEFLGEEEKTLVDYIVSSTQEHVQASKMLEMLQAILDEEAEMFVLKMWRMLIFEIKKVETGLALR